MDDLDEDYWGESKAKKTGKKVNIFDENVPFEAVSDMTISISQTIDDDGIETVGWDDAPVPKRTSDVPSVSYSKTPTPQSSVSSAGKTHLAKSPSNPAGALFNTQGKEPSLASMISRNENTTSKKAPSNHDSRVHYLEQQLEFAKQSLGASKLKVDETIQRMVKGMPFSLEQYKSKEEKLSLLDQAIRSHDGNAIIAAVLFAKRTLSEQLFNMELMRRPPAIDQYLAYLKSHYNLKELEYMLGLLGRTEELAMFKLKQAQSVTDPMAKIDRLKQCLKAHFEHSPGLEHDTNLITQQICLLQRQRPVDVSDDMLEKEGKHVVFRTLPRARSIVNMPVITTLYYCCVYHYDEPENLFSSPAAIRKEHQLTEKQYVWTAVKARARLKKWADIDSLFTTKGWLGGTKMKCVIGFDRVSSVLHKSDAPSDVVAKYLKLVDDIEKRLELAKKMQCHEAIIDTYLAQRDRKALENYFGILKPNSKEWFYAKDVLSSNSTKWKT